MEEPGRDSSIPEGFICHKRSDPTRALYCAKTPPAIFYFYFLIKKINGKNSKKSH
ncbi:hypothetical protein EDWATA_03215 [Edwardsiella tarda ATCC 23685]|uniref:Uncharacterized protein n=1 Tax=Edwardsiella tarda ATCC 23685 TaxID=500638 RepID=D4F8W2_EDWTA|nr:hypothetical protein EDWATA_03215 [Edwardsiella tarda ATCC 23685]